MRYEETYALSPEIEAHAVHPILDLVRPRRGLAPQDPPCMS